MENQSKETFVRKILSHEIAQVLTIIAVVYSFVSLVILPIKAIEKDIDNITGNHLMHIQDSIDSINDEQKLNTEEHKLIMMQMERTATIMEQHLRDHK